MKALALFFIGLIGCSAALKIEHKYGEPRKTNNYALWFSLYIHPYIDSFNLYKIKKKLIDLSLLYILFLINKKIIKLNVIYFKQNIENKIKIKSKLCKT